MARINWAHAFIGVLFLSACQGVDEVTPRLFFLSVIESSGIIKGTLSAAQVNKNIELLGERTEHFVTASGDVVVYQIGTGAFIEMRLLGGKWYINGYPEADFQKFCNGGIRRIKGISCMK